MARDRGLEELIQDDLGDLPGIRAQPMFGGWAWLLEGKLFCGARDDGMLIRLGKGKDGWALAIPGVVPMTSGSRTIQGWVRAAPEVFGDDLLRAKLLAHAIKHARSLS